MEPLDNKIILTKFGALGKSFIEISQNILVIKKIISGLGWVGKCTYIRPYAQTLQRVDIKKLEHCFLAFVYIYFTSIP